MRRNLIVSLGLISISMVPLQARNLTAQGGAAPVVRVQVGTNSAGKGKAATAKAPSTKSAATKAEVLVPLTERERAVQLLSRFTFGARPGDVDRVLAMGVDKWFEQQLSPDAIKNAALDSRLADFPTLNMTRGAGAGGVPRPRDGTAGGDGKRPMPTDPLLAADVRGAGGEAAAGDGQP